MIAKPSARIEAFDNLDPSGRIVPSAERLATAVLQALQTNGGVEISLAGLRGVPPTYFNIVLLGVGSQLGSEAIMSRVKFLFTNDAQRHIYQRSLDAVIASLAQAR
jgi:hypothetical protein